MGFKQWLEGRWFHGSHRDFDKFSDEEARKIRGTRQGADSLGQWFTSSQSKARDYGPKVYEYELAPQNPWTPPSEDFRSCFVVPELASKYLSQTELKAIRYQGPEPPEIDAVAQRYENGDGTPAERRGWQRDVPKWRQAERAKEKAFRKLLAVHQYWRDLRDWLLGHGHDSILWKNSRIDLRKEDAPHDVLVMLASDQTHVAKHG